MVSHLTENIFCAHYKDQSRINLRSPAHVPRLLFYEVLTKIEICRQMLVKFSINKSHKNPYIGTRTVPCRPNDGRKGITGLIVTFLNYFTNAPITPWNKSNETPI